MNVLAGLIGTNLPGKAIKQFLKRKECGTPVTSEQLELLKFPDQTAGASDSHVKTSQWPENKEDLPAVDDRHYFLPLQDFFEESKKRIDPRTYSLKMLRTYLASTMGGTSQSSKLSWMKSGMTSNGMFSIQPKSYLNTGKEFSLSDILEDNVPEKYFLSSKATEKLIAGQTQQIPLPHGMEKLKGQDRTLLKVNRRK